MSCFFGVASTIAITVPCCFELSLSKDPLMYIEARDDDGAHVIYSRIVDT